MTPTTPPRRARPTPRLLIGQVVRRSGDKTVAVAVRRTQVHPLYHKRRASTKIYLAHDATNAAHVGDTVTIREHRPLSARKRWTLVKI